MEHNLRHAESSNVPAWFERKFVFTLPVEQYPNVCIRLRGTPARLEEIMGRVPRNVSVYKPADKWSIQEHAGHLADLESLWMARVDDFLQGGETLTVADLSNRKTHEANHNARELSAVLSEFRTLRICLLDRISAFQPADLTRSMTHPRLKRPMRLLDHLYFVAEHDDHHLARIWEMMSTCSLS